MRKETIVADSDQEFVNILNETAFFPQPDTAKYMKRYARWAAVVDHKIISTASVENFVKDLKYHGYLNVCGNEYTLGDLQGIFMDTEYYLKIKKEELEK